MELIALLAQDTPTPDLMFDHRLLRGDLDVEHSTPGVKP